MLDRLHVSVFKLVTDIIFVAIETQTVLLSIFFFDHDYQLRPYRKRFSSLHEVYTATF